MKLQNLGAKKETEQRLREQYFELEQERDEIQLIRQQQEDELLLQQHERELEIERKKPEADEVQSRMKTEIRNGSSRASGSKSDNLQNDGSRSKLERTACWAKSVAQQSGPS